MRDRKDFDGLTRYAYDERGRLVAIDFDWDPATPYAGIHDRTTLEYDAADRLVRDTEVETVPGSRPSRIPREYQYDCTP